MSDDVEWFEELFGSCYDDVLRFAARRVGLDAAADVAAEVFATAWRRRAVIRHDEARLWLFGAARNVVLNFRRSEDRAVRLAAALAADREPVMDDPGDEVARRLEVAHMLDRLSEPDAELLRLTEWDGLTVAEAAKVLGCSAPAARVRLHRARRRASDLLSTATPTETTVTT